MTRATELESKEQFENITEMKGKGAEKNWSKIRTVYKQWIARQVYVWGLGCQK